MLFSLSARTLTLKIMRHQTIRPHLRSVTAPNVFSPRRLKENLCDSFDDEALRETHCFSSVFPTRVITRLVVRPGPHIVVSHQLCYGPRVMCQQMCLQSEQLEGPSARSALCSSCLFDRVMLRFRLRARRREGCNYPDCWIVAEF